MLVKIVIHAIAKPLMMVTIGIFLLVAAWAQNPKRSEIYIRAADQPVDHKEQVESLAFSPDGKTLATACKRTIKLWEMSSGRPIRLFEGHLGNVRHIAFSREGKLMLSVSHDRTIKLWEVSTGRLMHSLDADSGTPIPSIIYAAFSPDGETLFSGSSRQTIKLWKVRTGELIRSFNPLGNNSYISAYTLSQDWKILAAVDYKNTFTLWEMNTGTLIRSWGADAKSLLRSLEGHSQPANYLAFSPDGKMLLSASLDKTIKLWDVNTGRFIRSFEGNDFNYITFSSDARTMIAVSTSVTQHSFNFWELSTGRLRDVKVEDSGSYAAAISPDGTLLASSVCPRYKNNYCGVKILLARTGKQLATLASFDDGNWIAFTPENYYQSSPEASKYVSWVGLDQQPYDEAYIKSQFNYPGMVAAKLQERSATPQNVLASLLPSGRDAALVIGINNYQYLKNLKTAANDAEEVAKVLSTRYGFQTKVLINADANRNNILAALREYQRTLAPNDRLLIYYAGHGDIDRNQNKAYWKPVDARDTPKSNWISEDEMTSLIGGITVHHVLIISDSCYSATIVRGSNARSETSEKRGPRTESTTPEMHRIELERMMLGTSRILIASGGTEPVADNGPSGHSVFANALLSGLYNMDQPGFSARELFSKYIDAPVAGNSDQRPQYNRLFDAGHRDGDFVFIRRK